MSDTTRKEILVLDNAIADRETLLQGLSDDVEVILLDGGDSLAELADALSGRTDIEALHIVSHGSAGQLYLGGETLDAQTLAEQSATLARIGAALDTDGDILLYGCNTGAGEAGQAFVEQLALATGADVAASNDATGAAAMGGDWELEVRSGVLDNAAPLSREAVERYGHLLGTFDFGGTAYSLANGSAPNALVQQSVDGVQMEVTATPVGEHGAQLWLSKSSPGTGFTATTMYSYKGCSNPTSVSFSFSSAINISTLMVDTWHTIAENLVFTPTGGSNSVVNYATTADEHTAGKATLNWKGVTSFTITKSGGGEMEGILVDDIAFTTGPVISIDDVSIAEGNSGTKTMTFTVTRTDSSGALTVDYATADNTATAGSDYVAASGTLSFADGEASKTISVTVNGDTIIEGDETLYVNLSNASTGTISDTQGVGTITNDDTGSLTYSTTTFVEAMSDDGTISTTATITLTGDTFVGNVGDLLSVNLQGVPTGLITSLVKASDTTATLSFTGKAAVHGSDPSDSLQVSFNNAAFTGGNAALITNATVSNLKFDFVNTYDIDCIVPLSDGVISTNADGNIMKADSGTSGGIKFQNIVAQPGYTLVAQNNSNEWVTVTEGTVYANGGLFDKNSGDGVTVYYGIQGNFSGLIASVADAIVWRLDSSNDGTLDYQDSISLWYVPTPGTPDLAAASDSGVSSTDNITSDTTPTFTGTAEAGATVKLYDGTTEIGSGTATGGNWSITTSALASGTHTVTAKIWDAANSKLGNASDSLQITIDTAAPTFTSGDTATAIDENSGAGQLVYTVTATDAGSTTYSLKPGVIDVYAFSIDAHTGQVTLTENPDFESKPSYAFTVIATDAAGNASEQAVTLAVNDVNEAPVITSGDTGTVAENAPISTVIYTATASDVDAGTTLVYSLTGADADLLNIDASTGEVTLKNPADFEIKNSYSFNVVATDNGAGSLTGSKAVTISVTDVNETPTITNATYNAATGVLTITGTYIEANGSGADIDASAFTITGEGGETYSLTDTPDAERDSATQFTLTLSDADRAAVNQIINKNGATSTNGTQFNLAAGDDWCTNVTAGDTSDATNAVTVSNVPVPTITNATYNSATGVLTVTGTNLVRFAGAANDIDVSMLSVTGEGGSYTLTSLSDVEITSATSFTVTLAGADKIQVDARLDQTGTQSSGSTTYNLAAAEDWARGTDAPVTIADTAGNGITVTVNTAPVITSNGGGATAAVSVAENTTAVTTVTATDADTGQTITYSLNGGTDAAKFNIVGATGVLTFASAPNFENPTDSDTNNTYAVVVQADDGNGGTDFQTITVTVTDVAESSGGDGTTPAPDPTPILPPQDEWDALPDDDGDGIPEEVEALVPGLGDAPQGDGNGDGVMDTLQPEVSSVPFRETGAISDNPDAPVVFVTLAVTEDQDNKLSSTLRNVQQLDTPENLPGKLSMPLGVISFEATVGTVGGTESFSLYVDDSVLVNGYWKQNATGAWVNLASAAYGGKVLQEGGKIRLDFQITDGGEFDDDGVADGVITDPGALGWGGTFATFDHAYYLQSKLSQLQEIGLTEYTSAAQVETAIHSAGMTVYEHFLRYSLGEGADSCELLSTSEYMLAKTLQVNSIALNGKTNWTVDEVEDAFVKAGFFNAWEHFVAYGWKEDVNPSNQFDVSSYFEIKHNQTGLSVEQVKAEFEYYNLDPLTHYALWGQHETGVYAEEVQGDDRVAATDAVELLDDIDFVGVHRTVEG